MLFIKFLLFVILNFAWPTFYTNSLYCQENPLKELQELKNLEDIKKAERENLACFIDHLLYDTFFGYVLVGEKALSFDSIPQHKTYITQWWKNYSSLLYFLNHCRYDLGRGVFSRLDFSWGPNFFYFEDEENRDETTLYLTNKAVFEEVVKKNIKVFRDILGINLTAFEILTLYLRDKAFRKKILRNPYLLGILLGYGQRNASLYESMRNINRTHYLKLEIKRKKISSLHIRPCVDFSSVQKPYYLPIKFPGFVGDPEDIETKKIIEKFKKSRKKIFLTISSKTG